MFRFRTAIPVVAQTAKFLSFSVFTNRLMIVVFPLPLGPVGKKLCPLLAKLIANSSENDTSKIIFFLLNWFCNDFKLMLLLFNWPVISVISLLYLSQWYWLFSSTFDQLLSFGFDCSKGLSIAIE